MAINENELRAAIEAVLLVAGEPITVESLVEVFGKRENDSIVARLEEIRQALDKGEGGYTLEQAAGGYRLVTRPEFDVYLKKFFSKQSDGRLSIASLEVLSIVAYKQPITAPEIADIRSVNSGGVLRTLLDRKLVRISGRKNVVGSPFLYKSTKEFLLHFGLNSIQDLPRLEEFAEILGENLAEDLLAPNEGVDVIEGPDAEQLELTPQGEPGGEVPDSADESVPDSEDDGAPDSDEDDEAGEDADQESIATDSGSVRSEETADVSDEGGEQPMSEDDTTESDSEVE